MYAQCFGKQQLSAFFQFFLFKLFVFCIWMHQSWRHGLAPAAACLPVRARVALRSHHPTSKLSPRQSYPDAAVAAFFSAETFQ